MLWHFHQTHNDTEIWSLWKQSCVLSRVRRVTMCGAGSWRRSGRWLSDTPWWCWSPSTCTSSGVCRVCSDRSWACQRRGEFLCVYTTAPFCESWIVVLIKLCWRVKFCDSSILVASLFAEIFLCLLVFGTWVWNGTTRWSCLHASYFLPRSSWLAFSSCTTLTRTSWLSLTWIMYLSGRLPGRMVGKVWRLQKQILLILPLWGI